MGSGASACEAAGLKYKEGDEMAKERYDGDERFIGFMETMRWAFEANAEEMEKLMKSIQHAYDCQDISPSHFIALINCARVYHRIMKEEEHGAQREGSAV